MDVFEAIYAFARRYWPTDHEFLASVSPEQIVACLEQQDGRCLVTGNHLLLMEEKNYPVAYTPALRRQPQKPNGFDLVAANYAYGAFSVSSSGQYPKSLLFSALKVLTAEFKLVESVPLSLIHRRQGVHSPHDEYQIYPPFECYQSILNLANLQPISAFSFRQLEAIPPLLAISDRGISISFRCNNRRSESLSISDPGWITVFTELMSETIANHPYQFATS